ncbi:hypothetical protein CYMTET_21680 [Cymbomonas tetramitiformis]|uniref:Uncharacterized protein n=1 Tax=Cymbomonas tetramitiformis TaxID=36881 RepID=A0AAE0L2Q9_9CHLO|nr:hypothetical protein CYMTET_21680 [Cymbomonas tetramitiformis]
MTSIQDTVNNQDDKEPATWSMGGCGLDSHLYERAPLTARSTSSQECTPRSWPTDLTLPGRTSSHRLQIALNCLEINPYDGHDEFLIEPDFHDLHSLCSALRRSPQQAAVPDLNHVSHQEPLEHGQEQMPQGPSSSHAVPERASRKLRRCIHTSPLPPKVVTGIHFEEGVTRTQRMQCFQRTCSKKTPAREE